MGYRRRHEEMGSDGVWLRIRSVPVVEPERGPVYAGALVLGDYEMCIWLYQRPVWWRCWAWALLGFRWVVAGR